MKQIQPYVDRLARIHAKRMPERIFILDGFNPELFNV